MKQFQKPKAGKQALSCYLCSGKPKPFGSGTKVIAPRIGAFQCRFNDNATGKEIVLTWSFSDSEMEAVSLCDGCAGRVLRTIAQAYLDGQMEHSVGKFEGD